MKRIVGVKTGLQVQKTGATPTMNSKLSKSKKVASPGLDIPDKKEPKKSRWTFSSSHPSQPVGLSVRRDMARDATSKERPALTSSTAVAHPDRQRKSPKRLTQPPSWDQGRPLWGVKPDYGNPVRKDKTTSQTQRLAKNNTSLNASFSMVSERPHKPDRSIEERKGRNGGKYESRRTVAAEQTIAVQVDARVASTDNFQDAVASAIDTDRPERAQSKTQLKSALKKFPKTFHSAILPDSELVIEENSLSVKGVVDLLLPVPTISQEVSACHTKSARQESEQLDQEENPLEEFIASARRGEAGDSMPALITDPEDVETLRRLSNFNKENPNSNYYIEFNERELKGRESEKYGGIKKVMTPQLRSKRLSKRKSSMADNSEPEQQSNKERRSSSSSGGSVHRRQELHGLSS